MRELRIGENDGGQRLDRFLSKHLSHLPPSMLAKLIRKKHFRVNGVHAVAAQRLLPGDVLRMYLGDALLAPPAREAEFLLAPSEVAVVYEDENILIADKPAGLLSHSDEKNSPDTLISRILRRLYDRGEYDPALEQSFAPALCNRLDRNTSGLVIAAKNAAALRDMNGIIKTRLLKKFYLSLVKGRPPAVSGELSGHILRMEDGGVRLFESPVPGSKSARTKYRVLDERGGLCLLECELITGRTHQLRVQLAGAGCPILGDGRYGRGDQRREGQALCAWRLDFSGLDERAGGLLYLKNREFRACSVPFLDEYGFDLPGSRKEKDKGGDL